MKTCTKCGETKTLDMFGSSGVKRKDGSDIPSAACKQCKTAQVKRSQKANPELGRKHRRRYNERHGERVNKERRERYATDGEYRAKVQERQSRYYQEKRKFNPAVYTDNMYWYQRKWSRRNPGKVRAYRQRRMALKHAATIENVTHEDLETIWGPHAEWECVYCGAHTGTDSQIDHFMPLSLGGFHALRNLVPACRGCNVRKSGRNPIEWLSMWMTVEQREQWFVEMSSKMPGWAVADGEPFPALFKKDNE